MRLTTQQHGEHHVTIPDHTPLRIGTFNSIVIAVADHFGLTRDELLEQLFEKN